MVAFLVISHRAPSQVLRLVRVLREGESTRVVVRHDQRRVALDAGAVEDAGGRLLADGLEVAWGDMAYAEMVLDALREIHAHEDPDWVVMVSGQDYPLRPIAELERHLAETPHQALLHDCWPLDLSAGPPPGRGEFYRRYRYRHYRCPRRLAIACSRALRPLAYARVMPPGLPDLIGVRAPRLPFGPGLECMVSADWLMLERRAVASVLDFACSNRRAMRHYGHTVVPAESLFATALTADPSIGVGEAPRLVRFQPGATHPDLLGQADVPGLVASGQLLARKFDEESDRAALDALDQARWRGVAPRVEH